MRAWCGLLVLGAVAGTARGSPQSLAGVPEAVEKRYNRLRSLRAEFEESVSYAGRNRRRERGSLYLLRPGKMRWEYSEPAGKLFISDGKMFHLYSPNANQVRRIRPAEASDMRAPLAFLLGRLDLRKEFGKLTLKTVEEGIEMTALARSEDAAFSQAVFTIAPDTFQIRRIAVTGQDGMKTEFQFGREVLNPRLDPGLFRFRAPAGAEVVGQVP